MTEKPKKYRAERAESLIVQPLDVITLVYHRRSGMTHIVAEPVPQILAALADEPITAEEVVQKLSDIFDLGSAMDAEAIVAERLEELASLGLAMCDA